VLGALAQATLPVVNKIPLLKPRFPPPVKIPDAVLEAPLYDTLLMLTPAPAIVLAKTAPSVVDVIVIALAELARNESAIADASLIVFFILSLSGVIDECSNRSFSKICARI
jgi:hypothetical protein